MQREGHGRDVLRDLYVRGKYRDVILLMTVLRRLDAVLENTKEAVLDMKDALDTAGVVAQDQALRHAAGQAFYNTSKFTLRDLRARAGRQQLTADFVAYLDGFSPKVQDILDSFGFRNQIARLSKADALGTLIEQLTSPDINLSPIPVMHTDGSVRHPRHVVFGFRGSGREHVGVDACHVADQHHVASAREGDRHVLDVRRMAAQRLPRALDPPVHRMLEPVRAHLRRIHDSHDALVDGLTPPQLKLLQERVGIAPFRRDPLDRVRDLIEQQFPDEQGEPRHLGQRAEQQARISPREQVGVDGSRARVEAAHRVVSFSGRVRTIAADSASSSIGQVYSS